MMLKCPCRRPLHRVNNYTKAINTFVINIQTIIIVVSESRVRASSGAYSPFPTGHLELDHHCKCAVLTIRPVIMDGYSMIVMA